MSHKLKTYIFLFYSISIFSFTILSCAPEQENNEREEEKYKNTIKTNLGAIEKTMIKQGLTNIKTLDSSILVDLKYSSTDNFFGEDVYSDFNNAYLQKDVADALIISNLYLRRKKPNLRLIIFDAARPLSIQKILWEKLDTIPPEKRKNFVAEPSEGSIHNYGSAVDLSIFDTITGSLLDMGTKYDYFGDLAYPRLEKQMLKNGRLSQEQVNNRKLLREAMNVSGFMPITSEWWHFNYYSRNQAKNKFKIIN